MVSWMSWSSLIRWCAGGHQGERLRLRSCRGLAPRVHGRSELLPEVSPLLPLASGPRASERSLLGVAAIWDGRESAAWRWDAELLACCSWATQRSCFALFSCSLVFGSGMLEMSSRQQVVAAMLYTVWGKQRLLGAPCGHRHHCQEGAWLAAMQSPTFSA
jgi:hypothetical protein